MEVDMPRDGLLQCWIWLLLLGLPGLGGGAETPTQAAERNLATALTLLHDDKGAEALPLLMASVTQLKGVERRAAVNRTIGHLLWDQARSATLLVERDRLLAAASERYRLAASDGDALARRHYLSLEAQLSPERGYAAGWQYLDWNGLLAIDGWLVIAGNYGAVVTGGKGCSGLLDQHPLHALVWGGAILLLLIVAFISWRHGRQVLAQEKTDAEQAPKEAPRTMAAPPIRKMPATKTPVVPMQRIAKHPAGDAAAVRRPPQPPPPPLPASPVKRPKQPDLQHLRRSAREKAETETLESPQRQRRGPDDETEVGGLPVLPPRGGRPLPPQRPPR
jgi:hypothetical protein